jgi:type IV pilus assembly protein PilY1
MRSRPISSLTIALLCLAAVPLATIAAITVPPASKAACCTTFEPPPPPAPDGDTKFFEIPGSVPNVMLLLDSSGSMKEFPRNLAWQGYNLSGTQAQSTGTCALQTPFVNDTTAYTITDSKYDVPYDNGYSADVVDDPPWGLARCTAKQARPTTDGATDWCMFRPDSYYKMVNGVAMSGGRFWDDTSALVYNANPCAAVTSSGAVVQNNSNAIVTADVTACTNCLATKGYYIFQARYRSGNGGNSYANTTEQIVFSGRFLNAFPPKHVIARKVVKDLVKLDAANPSPSVDPVRFGLANFVENGTAGFSTSFRTTDGGRLVVPIGPSCTSAAHPETHRADYVAARQAIVDSINAIDDSWNSVYFRFASNTPLAESLFNIGQYFSNTGTSALYTSLFGASWTLPRTGDTRDFRETSPGLVNAAWAQPGSNQHSICWSCQQSSVVIVTDGEPNADSNLPASGTSTAHSSFNNDFRYWSNATVDCPACQCDQSNGDLCTLTSPVVPSGSNIPNLLHKVAYFLAQTDLRPDLPADPTDVTNLKQSVSTYTISFGLDASATAPAGDKKAIAELQKTAQLGGGLFSNTSSGTELRDALTTAVTDFFSRQAAFSSQSANALQTSKTNQVDAFLGRFRTTSATMWEGHLFTGMVFDEFGQGCDERFSTANQQTLACGTKPAQNPNMNGDEDASGRAICSGAYMVDRDCDPIIADAQGNFKKGTFDPTSHQLSAGPDDADMAWDAGKVLSDPDQTGYKSADETAANKRLIYTVIDVNGDGKLTAADGLVEFTVDNVAALAPAMGLDQAWCTNLLKRINVCGASPLPACPSTWDAAAKQLCAKQVIYFIRGYDVLDWDGDHCAGPGSYYNTTNGWGSCTTDAGCAGPGGLVEATCQSGKCVNNNCSANGEQRDRSRDSRAERDREFWKLGDIFHSSPVLVKPPIDKVTCSFGIFEHQCVPTLFGGSGWRAQSAKCYPPLASYDTLDAYDKYRSDNLARKMVVLVGANDGMLHAFDGGDALTGQSRTITGGYQYSAGTGTELWAFIPPDLLPRLRNALDGHSYFVDGNTMVRDVWIDSNRDGIKQSTEYRTLAVLSERGGGTRFTGLDVTSPTAPRFLWTFPEGCSDLSPLAGQTWGDFLPRAPPILPVQVDVTTADPSSCGFEERWIVGLNGGYDPSMVRGRFVALVDVATGKPIWKFTDADYQAMRGDTKASMFPVAATLGGMDIGAAVAPKGIYDTDGYFDTFSWGDTGGNVFVARAYPQGHFDAVTGLVDNWFAARTFEMNRKTDDSMQARGKSQFFQMTVNVMDYPSRMYVLLGSGNRERLLSQTPTCGPDNVLSCCQAQCPSVTTTSNVDYGGGSCSTGSTFTCNAGAMTYTPGTTSSCSGSYTCGPARDTVSMSFDCGSAGVAASTASFGVDATGATTIQVDFPKPELTVSSLVPACGASSPRDCYFAFWAYGVAPEKRFTSQSEAKSFESNRFTDVPSYEGCGAFGTCSVVDVTSVVAKASGTVGAAKLGDPGWKYCYGKTCPLQGCTETWCDEKTTSQPLTIGGCLSWSTFRPTGSAGSGEPCTPPSGLPTAFAYRANVFSGVPDETCSMYAQASRSDVIYGRATQKGTFAPPQSPAARATISGQGIQVSAVTTDDSGTEKKLFGKTRGLVQPIYQIEVPRVVHTCRHVDPTTCQ